MEKQKKWHLFVILAVLALTIYNILPTVFYYSKPLHKPVDEQYGLQIGKSSLERVNQLEDQAKNWIGSFCKLLRVKAKEISLVENNPQYIDVLFSNEEDARLFSKHLPKAGALIPFVPSQLSLLDTHVVLNNTVRIKRAIPLHFDTAQPQNYFTFAQKFAEDGSVTREYGEINNDRVTQLIKVISGPSENALLLQSLISDPRGARAKEFSFILADRINTYATLFADKPHIAKRYYATFTHGTFGKPREEVVSTFVSLLQGTSDSVRLQRIQAEQELEKKSDELEIEEQNQFISALKARETALHSAISTLKAKQTLFAKGSNPWTARIIADHVRQDEGTISLEGINPLLNTLILNNEKGTITLTLQSDVQQFLSSLELSQEEKKQATMLTQLIYNEVARISRDTDETFTPNTDSFVAQLSTLTNSSSMLVFNLQKVAKDQTAQIKTLIQSEWNPTSIELRGEKYPIVSQSEYEALPAAQKRFALVIATPITDKRAADEGLKTSSLYVIAKGIEPLLKKAERNPNAPSSKTLLRDLQKLRSLLQSNGYIGYPGTQFVHTSLFSKDYIFEAEEYYNTILAATREQFTVHGTKRFATLDFTNVEQRILTQNKIDTAIHEDLLKWRDEYNAAQVNPNLHAKFDVPKPTKSPLLSNLALSVKKYFRGDERKILNWGLDLSGGKTVQIELRDQNNKVVSDDADIRQGINELYRRVNKMGVSEVAIRQEGNNITLDFPGSQNLSATDLVKASSMYFHVVNEKFSPKYSELSDHVNTFLQDVWNEAVVTNKKDIENINRIACEHLYGDSNGSVPQPRSGAAKALYEAGLRIANPDTSYRSSEFDDALSKIALYRGESFAEWNGQANPLLIVFNNYVLEGSSLENIHAAYDPSKGNYLSFEIKGAQTLRTGEKINPRADTYAWTSHFSKEGVADTQLGSITNGTGWRMAVILNGSVISAPTLDSALDSRAMISGSFTQREVNKLEADLKAGSLTFTPQILSEKNISPELGLKDRIKGISATVLALLFVIGLMVGYYRFAGLVASVAVLVNLLIMWAALQNIQATITLAGIAGVILTVGMAVDANVLVFERVREEFEKSGRIASAIRAGYAKAFTAILDSNVTTIIAALILLNFDSGPIKGLALTLIIGIVSSMFTALFMTRYFFIGWIQNPKNTKLSMAQWFKKPNFPFLKYSSLFMGVTLLITALGGYFGAKERSTLFGMDFTGGFALQIEVEKTAEANYREAIEQALEKGGISAQEMEVRELSPSNSLKIFLSSSLDLPGNTFAGMPLETSESVGVYTYLTNPRIVWVVNTLEQGGIHITEASKIQLEKNWTSVSGQMSDTMREQALFGLTLALLCILLYIGIRFEFKYAIAATLGLVVDVAFTIGLLALLHALGVPAQIDLKTIAALMTIIGYSLNDTIIIFDRIREDAKLQRKTSFREIMHSALNVTLSRTIMTSTTTLVVLVALIALGGSTIFGLALVMIIGVCFGTLSSLFVASPLLLLFHRIDVRRNRHVVTEQT